MYIIPEADGLSNDFVKNGNGVKSKIIVFILLFLSCNCDIS
jgi:hypothetical protein